MPKVTLPKTKGGLEVKTFEVLPTPIFTHPLSSPMLYRGTVRDPKLKRTFDIQWDMNGRCSNPLRNDCYIEVVEFIQAIAVKKEIPTSRVTE